MRKSASAREAGVVETLVDGAHAPGQLDLNLGDLKADFYTGNCHKWLLAPKGSGFLHIQPEHQDLIEPLVVSWGWGENCSYESDTRLQAILEWWGTKDPAAYFSTPAAIRFQRDHNWDQVRLDCQALLAGVVDQIESLTGLGSIYGENKGNFIQIGAENGRRIGNPKNCKPGYMKITGSKYLLSTGKRAG